MTILVTWVTPTQQRRKLTAARLFHERLSVSKSNECLEVGRDVQHVFGLDDEAPPCPDRPCTAESQVLGQREVLRGAGKIGDAGEDESPLLVVNRW